MDATEAEMVVALAEAEAGSALAHENRPDAARAGFIGHAAVHQIDVRVPRARTPALRAAKQQLAVLLAQSRTEIGKRGPGVRLRHGDGNHDFAGTNRRQHPPPHFLAAEMSDSESRPETGFEDGKGDGDRYAGNLLEHKHGVKMAEPGAAILLAEIHAKIAEFGKSPAHLKPGRLVAAFNFRGNFGQLPPRKTPHGILRCQLFLA